MSGVSGNSRRGGPNLVRGGALDALRFAAAFFIVLYHYGENAPVSLFELHPAFERGYLATNFFLMLSGFVLASAYGPRLDERRMGAIQFLKKRLARIYPAHLVMLLAFVAVFAAVSLLGLPLRNPQWFDWSQLPAQVLLVQAWGLPGPSGWNIVTWSLSALVFCYAVFPFAWRVLGRIGPWAGVAVAVGLFAAADAFTHAVLGYPVYQMPLQFGVLRALPLFLLGVTLARAASLTTLPKPLAVLGTLGAFAAVIGLQLSGERHDYLTVAATGLMMFSAAVWRNDRSRVVAGLAAISFSLFITNYFLGVVWFGALRVAADRLGLPAEAVWAAWAAALPAAIGFAWLFDRLVDQPLQALVNRMRPGRPEAAATPAYQGAQ